MSPRGRRSSLPIPTPKTDAIAATSNDNKSPPSPPSSSPSSSSIKKNKKDDHGECVLDVSPNDVLLGRGSGPSDHVGNIKYRELIKLRKQEYLSANNRQAKITIASEIIDEIYQMGGRFLKKLNAVDAAYQLPKILEKMNGSGRSKKQNKENGDDKDGTNDKEKNDDLDGNHSYDYDEPRDVYEIQGKGIVLEKTKQALRQNPQRRHSAGSRMNLKDDHGEYVLDVSPNDVLLGRGSGPNDHVGNIKYRELIKLRKQEYLSANNRQAKIMIASEIIDEIYQIGGRFLKKLNAVDAAYQLPKILEKMNGSGGSKTQNKGNGDNKEGTNDKEKNDDLDDNQSYDYDEPRDVYEIHGKGIVLEKTKQALRQNPQRRHTIGSPTNLLQTRTPWPSNGFRRSSLNGFGGNNSLNINSNNQYFNDWDNGNTVPTELNGLSNNINNNNFSASLGDIDFNNNNNNKISSAPPLFSNNNNNQQQQQDTYKQLLQQQQQQQIQQQQQQHTNPMSEGDSTSFAQSLMQQEFQQLQEQQRMQEEQYRLEKEQFEKQQMQLERQKQELQQQLVLQLQHEQLRQLQEMQQQNKQLVLQQQHNGQQQHQFNNNNRLTNNNNDPNRSDDQQQQQQQVQSIDDNHKQQQHHIAQQQHHQQQQQQRFPTYTTTLEEMEDNRAGANNNNHGAYARTCDNKVVRDSVQSLGNISDMMNQHDQNNQDNMSTMMKSMKDMSVKDDELGEGQQDGSSNKFIETIDNISDKMIVRGFSSAGDNISGISMTSFMGMNDSTDMFDNGNTSKDGSHQNVPWGNSGMGATTKSPMITVLAASDLSQQQLSSSGAAAHGMADHHATTRRDSTGGGGEQQQQYGGGSDGFTRRQYSDESLTCVC